MFEDLAKLLARFRACLHLWLGTVLGNPKAADVWGITIEAK